MSKSHDGSVGAQPDRAQLAPPGEKDFAHGLIFGAGAFLIWGLSPIFWKLIGHVPAYELLAHRVIWCAGIMLLLMARGGRWRALRRTFSRPKVLLSLGLSTILIGGNWFLYIFAVTTDRILQASLGYFINPLISVLLGLLFLGERLRRLQLASVLIAALGVAILAWRLGHLPWLSLALALSFGVYGLVRKTVEATPEEGLALETGILVPIAVLYLFTAHPEGQGAWGSHGLFTDLMLVASGAITAVPLLLFTHGARRLPLSTLGLLQYLAPTGQFLLAVFVYSEPFDRTQLVAFLCIWTALAIFTFDARRRLADPAARHSSAPAS